jgi:hypothetical protein
VKNLKALVFFCVVSLLSASYLAGCSFDEAKFPSSGTNPQQVSIGPISGSVFGGHAPLVGAHVYLLQASTSGYGSPSTSLLTASSTATSTQFPVAVNTSDPIVPTFGNYYFETTDSSGSFNLTGDYTCTTGSGGSPGPPVYIYAYGGTPATPLPANTYTSTGVAVSGITGSGSAERATYTFTIANTGAALTAGELVSLSGFSGGSISSLLSGQSTQVLSSNLTSTTFALTLPDPSGQYSGAYATSGTITAEPNFNPAVVNLAVLGDCPASDNFASSISFVYMNEVSTVAAAYALSGFTSTTPASINALNLGASSTNLQGLVNAGSNANQLYDIQGSVVGTGTNGDNHIARLNTPVGSGTVSQSLIDSIANTLAACVDSGNTMTQSASACTVLFGAATADGTASGVKPVDTATAALNIAHNPYSSVSNYTSTIFGIATGSVPFMPDLSNAPNDFVVSIVYTGGGLYPSGGGGPHTVAVDGSGNIYTATSGNTLTIFSPLGAPASPSGFTGNGLNNATTVTVDAASATVWVANYYGNSVSVFTTAGAAVANYSPGGTGTQDIAFDSSGNAWISATSNQLDEVSSTGTVLKTAFNNGLNFPNALAIEPLSGNLWLPNANTADLSAFTPSAAVYGNSPFANNVPAGYGVAIDSSGNVWTTGIPGNVAEFSNTGVQASGSPFATGTSNGNSSVPGADGIAIDGSNNIWVTSTYSSTIYKLNHAGSLVSEMSGYEVANPSGSPDGIAIDGSGNVWYNTTSDSTLHELVGAAVPIVTPIAVAVKNNTLGTRP